MEHIPDIEDREFPTSQGHWTGDLTWEAEPGFGIPPAITATVNDVQTEAELTLSYPYIDTDPEEDHTLSIGISGKDGASENASGYATLTDGVYSYTIDPLQWYGGGFPFLNQLIQTIPADWNVANTQLVIHLDYVIGTGLTLIFMKFNLESADIGVTRVQYLPIMGVG